MKQTQYILKSSVNEAFREKVEKYRDWTMKETREKKVSKAVLEPVMVSHDDQSTKNCQPWKDLSPDIQIDCVRMGQNMLRFIVIIVG